MNSLIHLIIGIILVLIFGLTGLPTVIFILASVLIDLDHILEIKNIKLSLKQNYRKSQKSLHIFHTFEIMVLMFLISLYFSYFKYIAFAFLCHLIVDALGNIYFRNIKQKQNLSWIKYWFLIYYIKKKSFFN